MIYAFAVRVPVDRGFPWPRSYIRFIHAPEWEPPQIYWGA